MAEKDKDKKPYISPEFDISAQEHSHFSVSKALNSFAVETLIDPPKPEAKRITASGKPFDPNKLKVLQAKYPYELNFTGAMDLLMRSDHTTSDNAKRISDALLRPESDNRLPYVALYRWNTFLVNFLHYTAGRRKNTPQQILEKENIPYASFIDLIATAHYVVGTLKSRFSWNDPASEMQTNRLVQSYTHPKNKIKNKKDKDKDKQQSVNLSKVKRANLYVDGDLKRVNSMKFGKGLEVYWFDEYQQSIESSKDSEDAEVALHRNLIQVHTRSNDGWDILRFEIFDKKDKSIQDMINESNVKISSGRCTYQQMEGMKGYLDQLSLSGGFQGSSVMLLQHYEQKEGEVLERFIKELDEETVDSLSREAAKQGLELSEGQSRQDVIKAIFGLYYGNISYAMSQIEGSQSRILDLLFHPHGTYLHGNSEYRRWRAVDLMSDNLGTIDKKKLEAITNIMESLLTKKNYENKIHSVNMYLQNRDTIDALVSLTYLIW